MPKLYLGIDGGQSSTTALIANESGSIVGEGRGGPCNHVSSAEGRAKFFSAIGSCLEQACRRAGFDPTTVQFASACLGFSGGPEDKDAYSRELIRSAKYKITHDGEVALTGAFGGEPGIVLIAGTGSIAFGRNKEGQMARAGGWGYLFGDEGGAFDLVRRALRTVLQHEEGWGPPTGLRDLLLHATETQGGNDLLHRLYGNFDRSAVAALAPLVTGAAESGDGVAIDLLREATRASAGYVEGVYRTLFHKSEVIPIAHIGGVFKSPLVRDFLRQEVLHKTGCETGPPLFGPAEGAIIEALRLDGNASNISNLPA